MLLMPVTWTCLTDSRAMGGKARTEASRKLTLVTQTGQQALRAAGEN